MNCPTPDYISICGMPTADSPVASLYNIHVCSFSTPSKHHPKYPSPWLSASLPPSASPVSACLFFVLQAVNLMILTVRHAAISHQHADHCPTFHATLSLCGTVSRQGKKLLCLTFQMIPSKLWLLAKVLNITLF